MKLVFCSLLLSAFFVINCAAQDSIQNTGSASQDTSVSSSQPGAQVQSQAATQTAATANSPKSPVPSGSVIYAELDKSVDAKKAKQGDEVVAKTSQAVLAQGKVVIPRGAKLVGHVTQVKAHTKEQHQSELGVAFDHAVLKDGTQVPLSLTLQALGASPNSLSASSGMDSDTGGMAAPAGSAGGTGGRGYGTPSGGTMGTARSTVGSVANTAGNAAGNVGATAGGVAGAGQASANGHLGAGSRGVVGLSGLTMAPAASASQGSVITSQNKNVKLDSGTELVLKVN